MKSKLLPVLLILLVLLNGVLIFMLIKKPHLEKKHHSERNFLTEQLQFSDAQKEQFKELEKVHRGFMMDVDHQIRESKDVLFSSFNQSINLDAITNKIGNLEAKKERELFRFFSEVRKLCSKKQAIKFDSIIKKALKGEKRPPRNGQMPHSEGRKHHPPR